MAGGANTYGFTGGDPVNFDDPFGLCPKCPDPDPNGKTRGGSGEYGSPRPWSKSRHSGEDKLGTLGDPVVSPVSGVVRFSRNDTCATCEGTSAMGNNVLIEFMDGDGKVKYARIGHLGSVDGFAVPGMVVTKGEQIGTVGASGNAAVAGPGRTPLPMTHVEYRRKPNTDFSSSVPPSSVTIPPED